MCGLIFRTNECAPDWARASSQHQREVMQAFKNFIDGEWVEPTTGEYFANVNPADTSDEIGRFPLSGEADVNRAVEAAKRGFAQWRRTPAPARGDVLRRVGDLLT